MTTPIQSQLLSDDNFYLMTNSIQSQLPSDNKFHMMIHHMKNPANEKNRKLEMDKRIYIVINTSLKMGRGKIIAQVGHGISRMTEHMIRHHSQDWSNYLQNGERKITVKADQATMEFLRDTYNDRSRKVWCYGVIDMGLTQIPAGSLTCLVFAPIEDNEVPVALSELKLY